MDEPSVFSADAALTCASLWDERDERDVVGLPASPPTSRDGRSQVAFDHRDGFSTAATTPLPRGGIVLEDGSTSGSIENRCSESRLKQFREFNVQLVAVVRETALGYGFENERDAFLRELLELNACETKQWINEVFVGRMAEPEILVGVLRGIAHIDNDLMRPHGITMAVAALSHHSAEVRECGVRAIENWGTSEGMRVLEKLTFQESWQQEYAQQVLSDFKENAATVRAGAED
jgi:hypothetical protein